MRYVRALMATTLLASVLTVSLSAAATADVGVSASVAASYPPGTLAVGVHAAAGPLDASLHAGVQAPGVGALVDSVFTGLGKLSQKVNTTADTLFGVLTDGVCALGTFLPPPGDLLCDIKLLQFTWHTVYKKPGGGELVRDTFGLALVPTPVDINGDAIPDVIATVGLTSLNQLTVRVTRILGAPPIPASVELVVRDPRNVTSNARIAVGYDQRTSSIPSDFKASVTLKAFDPLDLVLSVDQKGADPGLTLTSTLFEKKDNGTRDVQVDARAAFVPAPATMSYDLRFGDVQQHLTYTATAPTRVTADVDLIDGPGEQTIHAVVDKLPSRVDFDLISPDINHRTVLYLANAPISSIDFRYRNLTHAAPAPDILNTELTGAIKNLPTSLTFAQTRANKIEIAAGGTSSIGLVEGGIAHGTPVLPVAGTAAGARVLMTGSALVSAAARLAGFRALDFTGPQTLLGIYFPLAFGLHTSAPQTFVADAALDDIHALATIEKLPADLSLRLSEQDDIKVDYDASSVIDTITLDAVKTTSFAPGMDVRRMHAVLRGIPASFTFRFGNRPADTGTTPQLTMQPPIGSIEVSVDDGVHGVDLPGTALNESLATDRGLTGPVDSGVGFVMLPGTFAAHALVYGLEKLVFNSLPYFEAVTAPGHTFDIHAQFKDAPTAQNPLPDLFTIAAEVDTLPHHIAVLADPGQHTLLDYRSFGDTIDRLEGYVAGPRFFGDAPPPGLPTKPTNSARFIYGKVLGLPSHITVTNAADVVDSAGYETTKQPFLLDTYGDSIKKVEFQALDDPLKPLAKFSTWSGGSSPQWNPASSDDADGLIYHYVLDQFGDAVEFTVALQLSGLAGAGMSMRTVPDFESETHFDLDVDPAYAQPFNLDVQTNGFSDIVIPGSNALQVMSAIDALEGFIDRPPPDLHIVLLNEGSVNDNAASSTRFSLGANGCAAGGVPCSVVGQAFQRIYLEGRELAVPGGGGLPPVGGRKLMADIQDVPNSLAVCMGTTPPVLPSMNYYGSVNGQLEQITGSGDSSGCLRPRPTGVTFWPGGAWPAYPTDEPTTVGGAPDGWGEMDANHSIVLDVDDQGTSGNTPMTIDAYICLKPLNRAKLYSGLHPNVTCDRSLAPYTTSDPQFRLNGPGSFVEINDLTIHNVMLDLFMEACSGALLCGHIGMDTRGKQFSGNFHFFDQTIQAADLKILLQADLTFPLGFNADYRYTRFRNQAIPPGGKYDDPEWGHVSCNSDSSPSKIPQAVVRADIAAGPTVTLNSGFFDRFLCHVFDTGKTNPWYPNG